MDDRDFIDWWDDDDMCGYNKYEAAEEAWHIRDKEIAELKAEISLHKGIQNNFNQLRADAIREMCIELEMSDYMTKEILEYADNLEKE